MATTIPSGVDLSAVHVRVGMPDGFVILGYVMKTFCMGAG